MKWDRRFLELARHISTWSKDPSTQVGAVIVRPDRTVASVGFNGFPRGMCDDPKIYEDRNTKLKRVVHAEMNAILNAAEPVKGYTIYVYPPFPLVCSCSRCTVHIIQAGISRIVGIEGGEKRFTDDHLVSLMMYYEAGVDVSMYDANLLNR